MKGVGLLDRFKRMLAGKYIFHLHTDYTDGYSSIHDYLEYASNHRLESVVFTEHVHLDLAYDFNAFCRELDKKKKMFPELDVWLGIEAKILANGKLDVPPEVRERVDLLCIACHSFPPDADLYFQVMTRVFQNEWTDKVRIWVHPGLLFLRHPQLQMVENWQQKMADLVGLANRLGIFGEINLKYDLPTALFPWSWFELTLTGLDAHSTADLDQRLS